MSSTCYYRTSPSHGWLKVSLTDFPDAENYGTGFGYHDIPKRHVYLEEDVEMPAFLMDHPEVVVVEQYMNSDAGMRALPHIEKRLDYDAYIERRYGKKI